MVFLVLLKISNPSNRKIEGGYRQIRSSAWLEHYTDNVGVSSSNLLGSTQSNAASWSIERRKDAANLMTSGSND